jgi:hypothetical protein
MNRQSIDDYFFKNSNVLIIDDIDAISSCEHVLFSEYKAVINDTAKKVPVIATYNKTNEKQIYDLIRNKRNIIYTLEQLDSFELLTVVETLVDNHHLKRCKCDCENCLSFMTTHCATCNALEKNLNTLQVFENYIEYHNNHVGNIISNIHNIFKLSYSLSPTTFIADPFTDLYTTDIASQILCRPEDFSLQQLEYVNKYDANMIFYAIHENYPVRVFKERLPEIKHINGLEEEIKTRKYCQLRLMKQFATLFSTADILEKYNNENMIWDGLGKPCENIYKIGTSKLIISSHPRKNKLYERTDFTKVLTNSAKMHNTFKKHCAFQMMNDIPVGNKEMLDLILIQFAKGIDKAIITSKDCEKVFNKANVDMLVQSLSDNPFLAESKKKCEKIAKKFLKI